jgi:hypothetical protein
MGAGGLQENQKPEEKKTQELVRDGMGGDA